MALIYTPSEQTQTLQIICLHMLQGSLLSSMSLCTSVAVCRYELKRNGNRIMHSKKIFGDEKTANFLNFQLNFIIIQGITIKHLQLLFCYHYNYGYLCYGSFTLRLA